MPININEGGRLSPFTTDNKLAPLFAQETEQTAQSQIFHLITLSIPDGSKFNIVDSNYDVKFTQVGDSEPTVFLRFPVKTQGASISSDGSIDKASITIANVSREIMYYIETYNGLRNMRVQIKTIYAKFLDEIYEPQADGTVTSRVNEEANNTAFIEDEYFVDNYSANEQTVTFQLDPIIDLEIKLPRRRYMVDSCYAIYKDSVTCKYIKQGVMTIRDSITGVSSLVPFPTASIVAGSGTMTFSATLQVDLINALVDRDFTLETAPGYTFRLVSTSTLGDLGTALVSVTYDSVFRGATCPITIMPTNVVLSTCKKTFDDCKKHTNEVNVLCFPGISAQRRIFL